MKNYAGDVAGHPCSGSHEVVRYPTSDLFIHKQTPKLPNNLLYAETLANHSIIFTTMIALFPQKNRLKLNDDDSR